MRGQEAAAGDRVHWLLFCRGEFSTSDKRDPTSTICSDVLAVLSETVEKFWPTLVFCVCFMPIFLHEHYWLQWIIPLEKYDLKRNTRIKQNPICYLHTICISFLDQPLPSPTRSTHPKLQNKEPHKPINKSKLEFLCVKLAFENVN